MNRDIYYCLSRCLAHPKRRRAWNRRAERKVPAERGDLVVHAHFDTSAEERARMVERVSKQTFWDRWRNEAEKLLAFCRRWTAREQDAQEVFAQTCEEAWQSYAAFRGECSFCTWAAGIARCNAAKLRKRQAKQRRRETPLGPEHESLAAPREISRPSALNEAAWLAAVVPQAVEAGHLAPSQATVLLAKFAQWEASWDEISAPLEDTAAGCRNTFWRAVTGLQVYLVVHCRAFIGGKPTIAGAFASAKADKKRPMTPQEVAAFEEIVIARRIDDHHRGWQAPLRSACAKVCRKIGRGNLPPPPGAARIVSAGQFSKKSPRTCDNPR